TGLWYNRNIILCLPTREPLLWYLAGAESGGRNGKQTVRELFCRAGSQRRSLSRLRMGQQQASAARGAPLLYGGRLPIPGGPGESDERRGHHLCCVGPFHPQRGGASGIFPPCPCLPE